MSDIDMQATWVTTLLDVGALRVELEEAAHKEGLRWYGDGKDDDLQDAVRYAKALRAVYLQYASKPDSWTRLLSLLANSVMFSKDEKELREGLIKLAAFVVSWVEDIDRRKVPGYKEGKNG